MKKSIQDIKIKRLSNRNKKLNKEIKELKFTISQITNNVSAQDYADVRLRAQKAELALEALALANTDNLVATNIKKYKLLEEIKILLEKFVVN